jgi:hypothetical protein
MRRQTRRQETTSGTLVAEIRFRLPTPFPAPDTFPSYDTRIPCDEQELQLRLMVLYRDAREAKLARIATVSVSAAVISILALDVSVAVAVMK